MARAPFGYYGGKFYMLPHLLPLLPAHHCYVEPFCGAAWLLLAKSPSPVEIMNDRDDGVCGFYRVLRDPASAQRLQALLELTPYSRTEYNECRTTWQACTDPVERARRWFVVARQSFAGRFGVAGWSYTTHSNLSRCITTSKWHGSIAGFPEVHERLRYVQIENKDWRDILAFTNQPGTLVYADPPYVLSSRQGGRGYRFEMSDADHEELIAALLAFRGHVIVSGYQHPIYRQLDTAGWHRIDVETSAHSAGRTRATKLLGDGAARSKQPRTESIWLNYDHTAMHGQTRMVLEGAI